MSFLESCLLTSELLFVLGTEFLVLADLLLELRNSGLERRLLQSLGLLVCIDNFLIDKFVKRFFGVCGEDSIGFGGGVLSIEDRCQYA